jgi:hypothetical protein
VTFGGLELGIQGYKNQATRKKIFISSEVHKRAYNNIGEGNTGPRNFLFAKFDLDW